MAAHFPQNIYSTRRHFDDYGADDMRYGDITQERLKNEFKLINISNVADPYTLTRQTSFNNPQSRFSGVYGNRHGGSLTVNECAALLFDEMQVTSLPYAMVGPSRQLINHMLDHLKKNAGTPFKHPQLDLAWRQRITQNKAPNSALANIKTAINLNIDYENKCYPQRAIPEISRLINGGVLPKFDSILLDKINGLAITVHDIHAVKIDLLNLDVGEANWHATVRFQGQDHFGLDVEDIKKKMFNQFQFFRIWFVLQRYTRFGFRPFLTNMEAIVDIEGGSQ